MNMKRLITTSTVIGFEFGQDSKYTLNYTNHSILVKYWCMGGLSFFSGCASEDSPECLELAEQRTSCLHSDRLQTGTNETFIIISNQYNFFMRNGSRQKSTTDYGYPEFKAYQITRLRNVKTS